MMRKKALNDIQQGLPSDPLPFKGVNVRATLELDPVKRPWNRAQAILTEHANVPREAFDIRWVDTGLRVSVTPPPARPALSALASFTTGANWALNFDRFRELALQVDPRGRAVFLVGRVTSKNARPRHGGVFSVALLHHPSQQGKR